MTGTILLTGGTGKTASRIAKHLQTRNVPVLLTSRKGQAGVPAGFKGVTFDWADESTYNNPFNEDQNIETIYIVVPPPSPAYDGFKLTNKFIDVAKEKGVKRFVLLSASIVEKGGFAHGQVHAHLDSIGVDYAVLKPSWFFNNFLSTAPVIKAKDEFVTATGTAKLGFVAEDDIADAAAEILTTPKLGGTERLIVGPELLSYDEVAEQLSQVLGRKITHRSVSVEERNAFLVEHGAPEEIAKILSVIEANVVAKGVEEKLYNGTPDKAVGKISFRDFAEANKAEWQK